MQFSVLEHQEKPPINNDINPTPQTLSKRYALQGPNQWVNPTFMHLPVNYLVYVHVDGRPYVPSDKAPHILA